jgi:hypothetical protein
VLQQADFIQAIPGNKLKEETNMINYNKADYRENENSEQEGVAMNSILRRDKNGKIIEIDIPDDTEEEE